MFKWDFRKNREFNTAVPGYLAGSESLYNIRGRKITHMADKRGPKGPRNKVRQVVLVEGHPDCIFETKPRRVITIKHGDTVISLGNMGPEKVKGLKAIPGIQVIEELKPHRRAKKLPSVLYIKTTGTSTQLTVAATDKISLNKAVGDLADYLSKNGLEIHERCQWVCTIDKGKPAEPVQPDTPPEPVQKSTLQDKPASINDRIMNYLKDKSSFSVMKISSDLNIPEETIRKTMIEMGFVIPRKPRQTDNANTMRKGRYGTIMETGHAPG